MIRKFLSQRYPYEENKWKVIVPISLFVAFFMVIFQPFGLDEIQSGHKIIILAGYGLVTFAVLALNMFLLPAVFPQIFRDERWTVMKELGFFLLILFTIGLGNLFYSSRVLGFRLDLSSLMIFQGFTLAIGFIPVTAITLVKQGYLSRKNRESAERLTSLLGARVTDDIQDQMVRFTSDNVKEELTVLVREITFIRSEGNYITIGYFKNGTLTKMLLRNTMKYAADILLPYPVIFRCHRSWMVNLFKINKVNGNSQGLRLSIEGYPEEIPVARNLARDFRRRFTGRII